jgi:hypothetical protein
MTSVASILTIAATTPSEVTQRHWNGQIIDAVFKNGFRKNRMWSVME